MTSYGRAAYGAANPNAGYPANGDVAVWGNYRYPGGVSASLLAYTSYTSGTSRQLLKVQMRKELVPLWNLAFEIMDRKYKYPVWASRGGESWGPWGYSNRPISGTQRPSGHSAALSVDINAPYNPYSSAFQSDMPPGMVADLESLGLYWGGRYTGQKYDAMHYGFCRKPGTVTAFVNRAKRILAQIAPPKPPPEEKLKLDAEDQAFIQKTCTDAINKALRTDKFIVTNDRASTPNDIAYSFETGMERIIRLTSGTFVGESGKPH